MNKYKTVLLNPYIPPSAVYRYSLDISNAVENVKLFTFINDSKSVIPDFSKGSFVSGNFKRIEIFNKLLPSIAYDTFIDSIQKETVENRIMIIHYAAPMNQIKLKGFTKVVTFHDPVSILLDTQMFKAEKTNNSPMELFQRLFQRRYYNSFKGFDNILCVSEYVKSILIADGFSDNIRVIYPAIPPEYRPLNRKYELRKKLNLPVDKKLVLSVSTDLKKKNLGIVKETMLQLGSEFRLVRVGKSIMEGDISFQGVSYDAMNEIYNACDVMLFPSLYEGFGYPLVEAFATGLPVVASDIEVFREVSGEAAALRDPNDVSDLVSGVKLAFENSEDFNKKGIKRAERFSFERFSNEMSEYYSSILS